MIFPFQNDIEKPILKKFLRTTLALFIISIPVVMILIFSFSIVFHGSPEFRVDKTQHGLKIRTIHKQINPVQKNDIITRINGLDYNHILSFLISPNLTIKKNIQPTVTILRHGQSIQFTPRTVSVLPFEFLSVAWPHLGLMLFMILLGVISFFRISSSQPVILFLTALSMFATTLSATFPSYFGILDPQIISLSFFTLALFNWLAFGAYLHFVFSFPSERDLIRNNRWLVPVFYLAAPLISIMSACLLAESSNDFWTWLQRVRNTGLPFMAILAFVKHSVDYRKISSSLEKKQVKLIISAYWLSFGPYLVLYAIPNMLFNSPIISFKLVVISGAILPGAYFVSLIRYKLLDADSLISRTVSYVILIGLLAISYSYLFIFLKRTFIGQELFTEEFFLIYMISIAILFEPLKKGISLFMDKIFIPKALYQYDMMPRLSRSIGTKNTLDSLIYTLVKTIPEECHIQQLMVIIFGDTQARFYPDNHTMNKISSDLNHLKGHFSITTDYIFSNKSTPDASLNHILLTLRDHGVELLLPLRGGTGLTGALLISKRADNQPYSRRDIQFFITIANQAGLALENSLHYESLIQSKKQVERMFGKVVESEKMAALGEMSTILAHELKNPLSIIRSSAQFLTKQTDDTEHHQELLNYIISEVDGLESAINNMMGLARYKSPDLAPIDLYDHMTAMLQRWNRSGNHNPDIVISLVTNGKIPRVIADFKQLQQVFLNCITNAEDAMPDGGHIDIILECTSDNIVDIHISDTGPGIPAENLENAFKQFFTTKEKGMGIGLPVCRQIIIAHNGNIVLKNKKQGGLMVFIQLHCDPVSAQPLSKIVHPKNMESSFA